MVRPVKVGLSGVSHWHAPLHRDAFMRAGATISAVCDSDAGVVERWTRECGCGGYPATDAMLERAGLDFVMVMGTPSAMLRDATTLVNSGIPFAVEKPVGRNALELEPLVEAAAQKKAFAAVPLVNRHSKIWQVLADMRAQGRVQRISHAHFRIVNGAPSRYVADGVGWMLDPAAAGGGAMRNLGIHAADAFLALTEGDTYEVRGAAMHGRIHGTPVEEFGTALVVSRDGVAATLEAGYSYATRAPGGDFEWRIAADTAYLVDRETKLHVKRLADETAETVENLRQPERYDAFAADVLMRLRSDEGPRASLGDCYRAMELLDRVYAAAGWAGQESVAAS